MSHSSHAAPAAAPSSIQAQAQDYIAKVQASLPKALDQIKKGKLELPELLNVTAVYLGLFSIVALVWPGAGTLLYGGDGEPNHYSNDWVKFGAVSNLAIALLAAMATRWADNVSAKTDVLRVLFVFFALDTLINVFTLLYGSLSFIVLANAGVDGLLAYFYGQRVGIFPAPKP